MLIIKFRGLEVPVPRHVEVEGPDAVEAYVEDKLKLARKLSAETATKEEDTDVGD